MAMIPVAVAAASLGWRWGVLAGLLAFPVNTLMFNLAGEPGLWAVVRLQGGPGSVVIVLIGAAVGWMRDLSAKLHLEITRRRDAEQTLERNETTIESLYETVVGSGNFSQQVTRLLEIGCRHLDMELGMLAHIEGDNCEIQQVVAQDDFDISPGTLLDPGQTFCCEPLRTNGPIGFCRAAGSEWEKHPAYLAFGLESYIASPVHVEDGVYGTLAFSSRSRREEFSEFDFHIVQLMARWIGNELARQQAEIALRESDSRFRNLVAESAQGIVVQSGERAIYANQAWADTFGYTVEEVLAMKSLDEVAAPHERQQLAALRDSCFRGDSISSVCEFEGRRKDGTTVWVQNVVRLIEWEGETAIQTSSINITKRRELQDESQNHQKLLAQVSRVATLGEMATGLAHELNQPLGSIANLSAACSIRLKSDPSNVDRVLSTLEQLTTETLRAGSIVDRIRKFIGKAEFEQSGCRVKDLIDNVLSLLESELTKREITVNVNVPDSSVEGYADRIQIEQVLVNLVHNAIDAMSDCETDQRHLDIAATTREDGFVEIGVRDSGHGMTDGAARVFDAFYSTKSKGMGMGLAICRTIIESHGGRIIMTSEIGEGTTCTFTLPAVMPQQPAIDVVNQKLLRA